MSSGWTIYAIGPETGPVKVGFARDVVKRFVAIQIGSPQELKIIHTERIPHSARLVEREAHRLLEKHHVRGEWFDAPHDVAITAIRKAASRVASRRDEQAERLLEILERAAEREPLHEDGLGVAGDYIGFVLRNPKSPQIHTLDKIIRRRAGDSAWNTFRHWLQGRDLEREYAEIDPMAARQAQRNLVKAINALAGHRAERLGVRRAA